MNELEKDRIILELQQRVNRLEGKNEDGVPSYSFSKIRDKELESIVEIQKIIQYKDTFDEWFSFKESVSDSTLDFLEKLIDKNITLINSYHEEDLKINFIAPLIAYVDFFMLDDNIRSFYDEKLTYKTDKFILNGEADFIVSKGLEKAINPYFFIQEFKRAEDFSNPRPQLLAELISAIELNNELSMRGAYIVGENWNFVILEKLGKDKYQYFVSRTFNCTNIEDLKGIYRNLMFVKEDIIEMLKEKPCVQ